ncbi:MAG: hypothetical protein AAFN78_04965 [Pseudomonadota bacterium]
MGNNTQQQRSSPPGESAKVPVVLERTTPWQKFRQDAIVVAGGLVLFLAVMLVLFDVLFPVGTRLSEGLGSQAGDSRELTASGRRLAYEARSDGDSQSIASIENVRRSVRFRASDSLVWSNAVTGDILYDRDSVQTLDGSGAVIRFNEGSELNVGEQSIVVLQRGQQDPFLAKRRSTIVMVEGTLSGRLAGSSDSDLQLEIEMPNGMLLVQGEDGGAADSEFRLEINPDDSTSVSLMSGAARIYANGRVVSLNGNEGLVISGDGKSFARVALPVQPVIDRPRAGQTVRFNDLPPAVDFNWHSGGDSREFRFILATDPELSQLLVDQRLSEPRFSYGNLGAGEYYWTVKAVAGWNEGPQAPVRELVVVRDTEPPMLELDPAPAIVHAPTVVMSGRTEPGSKVFIQGEPVTGDARGFFNHIVHISPGTSVVLVEAMDSVGNVAYASQTVTSKAGRY